MSDVIGQLLSYDGIALTLGLIELYKHCALYQSHFQPCGYQYVVCCRNARRPI